MKRLMKAADGQNDPETDAKVARVCEFLGVMPEDLEGASEVLVNALLEKCSGLSDPTADAAALAEQGKVKKYAERPEVKHALDRVGQTPAQFVAKFNELRKKKPDLTAEQYGVLS